MNWDEIEGDWKQVAGKVKAQWGRLTDDDITHINGKKEELIGKLQQRYGETKDEAEKRIDEFVKSLKAKLK